MSDFGDFDPDDALDHEPADPEQVAIRLARFRAEEGLEPVDWSGLNDGQRAAAIRVVVRLLALLRRQGAS